MIAFYFYVHFTQCPNLFGTGVVLHGSYKQSLIPSLCLETNCYRETTKVPIKCPPSFSQGRRHKGAALPYINVFYSELRHVHGQFLC